MTNPSQKGSADEPDACNQKSDIQTYLISRYREALKSGDKSFAKSCLLSTSLFSVDDPIITNEIYLMAKADGDIGEAAKCFANIFENLFSSNSSPESLSNEALVVANQMKEETRLLLNELKSQHLLLRSTPAVATSNHARQNPSVCQSPLLSPRLRMSSEDRSVSRDSVLRLDKHLSSTNKSLFYQQLYEHLNQDVRISILNHWIDNCDNPFERCRFMMLSITLFNSNVTTHGQRLLKTLIDLSRSVTDKSNTDCDKTIGTVRPQSICRYARSMLVLDAIPFIFSLGESRDLEFDLYELFQHIIDYYSEFCLEKAAEEYEFDELHEGMRKVIAARNQSKDISVSAHEDSIEEALNQSLHLLFDRFLHEFSNDTTTIEDLKAFRQLIGPKDRRRYISFEQVAALMSKLEHETDIPENILFSFGKDEGMPASQATTAATPPPKGRGRPKKVQQPTVIVSPDDGVRRHLQRKSKEALFIFTSILQHMFVNCSIYLKQTRSRIFLTFNNPLADQIQTEISKSSSQRSSRGKSLGTDSTNATPSKKIRTETQSANKVVESASNNTIDFSNGIVDRLGNLPISDISKKSDLEIVETLKEVHRCLEFLQKTSTTFDRLFKRFLSPTDSLNLKWFLRVNVDCMILSGKFNDALGCLRKILSNQDELRVKKDPDSSELSTLTVSTGTSPSVQVHHLRALTQAICCNIQLHDKKMALDRMTNLFNEIKQSGLITNDENYSTGNVVDEYRAVLTHGDEHSFGFLFFDSLSLIRYVVNILMDLLRRHIAHPDPGKDAMIGHTIVLSQFDWPNQISIYDSCIAWIRTNKPKSTTPQCLSALTKFTYPEFFNYVTDPNVLEDFMALLNEGITLDIKSNKQTSVNSASGSSSSQLTNTGTSSVRSSSGSTRSGKAITTRGVNKTFKEDLKVALVAQMKNSSPMVPLDLVTEFVRASLIPFLMSTK